MHNSSNSLHNLLVQVADDRDVLFTDNSSVSALKLRVGIILHEAWLRQLIGRRVAIQPVDQIDRIFLLLLLDGISKSVLLLPRQESEKTIADLCIQSEVDILVPSDIVQNVATRFLNAQQELDEDMLETEANLLEIRTEKTEWVLSTSGTTGPPKLVSHTWNSLTRAIKISDDYASYRWGLLYGVDRFAGLQVLLQSLLNRASLILPSLNAPLENQIELLLANQCNALSATPTLWRRILMSKNGRSLPLRQITLGGEIADGPILKALAAFFPNAHITHIYASTEAGVGFSVHDGHEGFPAAYLNSAPGHMEIDIDEDGMLLLRPENIEQRFVGRSEEISTGDGWIRTGDLVFRKGERFVFLGRANGSINVGGHKVHPEEVEKVIAELPEVSIVRVIGKRSSIVGSLVQADVVPSDKFIEKKELASLIRSHCQNHLAPYKVPAIVNFVGDIDTSAGGKVIRR